MFNEIDPKYTPPWGRLPGDPDEENSTDIPDNFSDEQIADCCATEIPQVGDQVLIWAEGLHHETIERWGTIVEVKKDGNKGCSIKITLDPLPGEKKQRTVCRKPDGIIFHRR